MNFFIVVFIIFTLGLTNCNAQKASSNIENTPVTFVSKSYQSELKSIETERQNLFQNYRNTSDKKDAIDKTRLFFISATEQKIIPFWYGTDWDFYGTTEIPKSGKIACGYFVTTVLRDVGLRVNRVSLAQQASENIIKSLMTNRANIKRFHNAPIEKFVADVKTLGAGLYVVGLDNHVGFIFHDGAGDVYFIHSSYLEPSEVIKEKAIDSPILSSSKYRVIGKISGDDTLMVKWLSQALIPTIKN